MDHVLACHISLIIYGIHLLLVFISFLIHCFFVILNLLLNLDFVLHILHYTFNKYQFLLLALILSKWSLLGMKFSLNQIKPFILLQFFLSALTWLFVLLINLELIMFCHFIFAYSSINLFNLLLFLKLFGICKYHCIVDTNLFCKLPCCFGHQFQWIFNNENILWWYWVSTYNWRYWTFVILIFNQIFIAISMPSLSHIIAEWLWIICFLKTLLCRDILILVNSIINSNWILILIRNRSGVTFGPHFKLTFRSFFIILVLNLKR